MLKSTIERGRVAVILRPIFTSTIVNTMTNYDIARGRVDGIKRPMYISYINHRHFNNFIIKNTIAMKMLGGIVDGLLRTISNNSITNNLEITCSDYQVGSNILVLLMASGN